MDIGLFLFFLPVTKKTYIVAPGWLSQLSVQLLISAQVLISRSVQAPHFCKHSCASVNSFVCECKFHFSDVNIQQLNSWIAYLVL